MLRDHSENAPRLAVVDGPLRGHVFELNGGALSIGRGSGNRVAVADPSLSRRHCVLEVRDAAFWLRDFESHNGTFVNGVPVREQALHEGDEIRAGRSVFRFLIERAAGPDLPSVRFESSAIENPTVVSVPAQSAVNGYRALLEIAGALHSSAGAEALADALLTALLENLSADRAAVLLYHEGDDNPFLASTRDRVNGAGVVVDANRAAVVRAMGEGVSVLSAGLFIAAPLISRKRPLGVIYLDSKSGRLTAEHLELAAAAGLMCGPPMEDALEFRRVEEENRELREQIRVRHEMVGESSRMQQVYGVVARAAPTDSTVLILGETGTGKELVARAIHRNSARQKGPFVAINCAALTETLLESELFGHERGAFTGAMAQKKGKLEVADRGTVFLDEIGDVPPALQVKLLRVLQEREFERVGGTRTIRVDIRVVAATNRDLRAAVEKGSFRDDLYYRLNVVTIKLPALRERREDIPLLANYFLSRCTPGVRKVSGISGRARACLVAYDWPGNVRELQHAIESAVILGTSDQIQPEDLPEAVWDATPAVDGEDANSYHVSVREQKSELILGAIEQAGGNITEAAKVLRLNPNYLHRLIRNLGLRDRIRSETRSRH